MRHLIAFLLVAQACHAAVEAGYRTGPRGLESLRWGDWEFIGDPSYQGDFNLYWTTASFRRADGGIEEVSERSDERRVATVRDAVGLDLSWGRIRAVWQQPAPDRLTCTVTVTNTSARTLVETGGMLLILDYPSAFPAVQDGNGDARAGDMPHLVQCLTTASYLVLDLAGRGSQVLAIEGDQRADWSLGRIHRFNDDRRFGMSWGCAEAIPPGESRSQVFGLRRLLSRTRRRTC
jgi:hypothetical protein